MNRLQKKCVIGTVGIHLLLLVILIVGPAFYNQQPKMDDTQVLDMIPANLVDAAVNSGVQGAQPPPMPKPVTPQPPQQQQLFPPPKIVQPPTPAPAPTPAPEPVRTPSPSLLKEFEDYFKSKPEPAVKPDLTPEKKPTESTQPKIQISLNKVSRNSVKNTGQENTAQNQRAVNNALRSLSHSLSSATTVDMPGNSSAAYASYASVVKSVYEQALRSNLPSQVAGNSEVTKVRITIANDGTVISSEVISPSGDPAWDDAVQRTLDQVKFIAPFPDGAAEKQRQYTLNFNPEVERSF
jgi:colicin import membrane protein